MRKFVALFYYIKDGISKSLLHFKIMNSLDTVKLINFIFSWLRENNYYLSISKIKFGMKY